MPDTIPIDIAALIRLAGETETLASNRASNTATICPRCGSEETKDRYGVFSCGSVQTFHWKEATEFIQGSKCRSIELSATLATGIRQLAAQLRSWVPAPHVMSGWDDDDGTADENALRHVAEACQIHGVEMPAHVAAVVCD